MLKDNHIDYCGGVTKAIETTLAYLAREKRDIPVIVETRTLAEVRECLEFPMLYRILLDNMSVSLMRETVALVNRKIPTEASGNITRETIVAVAETGVDYISMGAITYSAGVLDISLKAVS
ncbi:MAG: nicotinate-nucleotide diphosphorylase (carboxylating) [Bacteroidetes bacterium]|nr:nicotinate-nucleotide diphosphorylase (carboxylating) [Bacteroidota bacterium]